MARMGGAKKAAQEFREETEKRHADLPPMEELKALLVDILCLLHMEFYIRPQFKDE